VEERVRLSTGFARKSKPSKLKLQPGHVLKDFGFTPKLYQQSNQTDLK